MGHVARALKAHVAPKTEAVWWHRPTDEPAALAAKLREAHPVVTTHDKITSGVLMTTDPKRAQRTLTMLVVGTRAIEAIVATCWSDLRSGAATPDLPERPSAPAGQMCAQEPLDD